MSKDLAVRLVFVLLCFQRGGFQGKSLRLSKKNIGSQIASLTSSFPPTLVRVIMCKVFLFVLKYNKRKTIQLLQTNRLLERKQILGLLVQTRVSLRVQSPFIVTRKQIRWARPPFLSFSYFSVSSLFSPEVISSLSINAGSLWMITGQHNPELFIACESFLPPRPNAAAPIPAPPPAPEQSAQSSLMQIVVC